MEEKDGDIFLRLKYEREGLFKVIALTPGLESRETKR
jgi:hypothetical protein